MRGIRLSKDQAELLLDRLSLPDCIRMVMEDDEDDEIALKAVREPELVDAFCAKLSAWLKARRFIPSHLYASAWERWIIAEAIEGATILGGLEDDEINGAISRAKLVGMRRAARTLSRKLADAGIENSGMPYA